MLSNHISMCNCKWRSPKTELTAIWRNFSWNERQTTHSNLLISIKPTFLWNQISCNNKCRKRSLSIFVYAYFFVKSNYNFLANIWYKIYLGTTYILALQSYVFWKISNWTLFCMYLLIIQSYLCFMGSLYIGYIV